MGGLLRGPAATPSAGRADAPLRVETAPAPQSALDEPSPLFPEVMGPLPPQSIPPGLTSLSAQGCGGCHLEPHRQWSQSTHAAAWTDPVYQAAWVAAGRPNACIHCHTPLTEQQPQRIVGFHEGDASVPRLADNPLFEASLQEEGVTCAACHVRDGVVWGTRTLAPGRAPHPVRAHPDLARPTLCGACHQLSLPGAEGAPFYDTLGEWSRSSWGAQGVTCQDCHMPWELAAATRPHGAPAPRRSHRFAGGADDETVVRALTITLQTDKPAYVAGETVQLTVRVMNTGAGHAVPTTAPFRRIVVVAGPVDDAGALRPLGSAALQRVMDEAPPFSERADERLQADSALSFVVPVPIPARSPAGTLTVAAEVVYQAVPEEVARAHGLDPALTSRVVMRRSATLTIR